MCGIVGYIGPKQAAPIILDGLARLEYRGYDSAGVAIGGPTTPKAGRGAARSPMPFKVAKTAGRVRDLADAMPARMTGTTGIGHTRWATHGGASDDNAHPHVDAAHKVAVVHNGIIDNAGVLRERLVADGVEFSSETDTEVIAHLIGRSSADSLEAAVLDAIDQIEGTYGLVVMHAEYPDRLVAARNGSPLIIGVGDKEMHIASDLAALVRFTRQVVHLDEGELATITATDFHTFTDNHNPTHRQAVTVDVEASDADRGDHDTFMLKEILEQPAAAERVLRGRLDDRFGTAHLGGLNLDPRETRAIKRVKLLGCGSAYYVGQLGAGLIEELARIPADAEPASEFRYRDPIIEPDTLYVAISQSGETIDTLLAVQEIKRKGGRVIGLVNVVGSALARDCDGGIYLHAGPEVAVASTKALTNMSLACALLALHLGRVRDLSIADGKRIIAGLRALPGQLTELLADVDRLKEPAARLSAAESVLFIGRVRGYPVAREGAQKFKEISYRHAEAYPTSELKHGPLALIGPAVPTVAVVPQDELTDRNLASLHEIAARDGSLYVITHAGVQIPDLGVTRIDVPKNEPELDPILLTIPMQLLAYHAAVALDRDIDKPRNLAKSVTVE